MLDALSFSPVRLNVVPASKPDEPSEELIGVITRMADRVPKVLAGGTFARGANLTTNAAAIVAFALTGNILWGLGLAMGAANLTGGFLGARTALKHGNAFVRKVFLVVVFALALKLAWDTWFSYLG